jgi:6-pyruvoyltetrahydropterin/6-carboxytetrahydropterin synthase
MKTITKEITWEGGHRLYDPRLVEEENKRIYGKCFNIHGHRYCLRVSVSAKKEENGFILNFVDFKQILMDEIHGRFDHAITLTAKDPLIAVLRDTFNLKVQVMPQVTSCENHVEYIAAILKPIVALKGLELTKLTLWETATSECTVGITV